MSEILYLRQVPNLPNTGSAHVYSSTEYDKEGLAAYKACDDYRIFEEGYVESLLTKPLPSVIYLAICLKIGS